MRDWCLLSRIELFSFLSKTLFNCRRCFAVIIGNFRIIRVVLPGLVKIRALHECSFLSNKHVNTAMAWVALQCN